MKQPLSILIACVLLTGCTHTEPSRALMNRRFSNRIEQSKATSRDKPKSTVNYIDLGTVPAASKLANTPAPPEIQPRTATISVPKPKTQPKPLPPIIEGGIVDVAISWNADKVNLANTGSSDITGKPVTIYLNGHYSGGYKATTTGPARGQSVTIYTPTFIRKKDSARFNGYTHGITRLYVHCPGHEEAYYTAAPNL